MAKTVAHQIGHWARVRPQEPAILGGSTPLSWSEYATASDQLAAFLLGTLGLERGQRVGVLLPDGPGVHIAFVGCEKAGLTAVGIGPRAGRREIEHLLHLTGAGALLSSPVHQDVVMANLVADLHANGHPIAHHVAVEGELRTCEGLRVDGKEPTAMVPAKPASYPLTSDELFLLNSTSGTTGMPKCVTHDQDRWFAFHDLAVPRARLDESDIFMSVLPAPFGFGIWTSHVTPALLGSPCVVMPRFDAEAALTLIETHRVSVLAAVSTQFIMMLESQGTRERDLSSLRVLFTGGEAVPYARAAEFEDRTGARVLQFYGSNETGAVSATSLEDSQEKRLRTAGRPIPEMNVRLFNEAGQDVTSQGLGRPGCRGPTLSRGYFGPESEVAEQNRELIRSDGWMMLGDLAKLDDEGYLSVVGRVDDFIIRGGKNISGPAVEEQVAQHPAVALAAAIAMPDPVFGERVCVYLELRAGYEDLDLEDLLRDLRTRGVSKENLPERIVVVDQLPRNSGGKVAKHVLRSDIARRLGEEP